MCGWLDAVLDWMNVLVGNGRLIGWRARWLAGWFADSLDLLGWAGMAGLGSVVWWAGDLLGLDWVGRLASSGLAENSQTDRIRCNVGDVISLILTEGQVVQSEISEVPVHSTGTLVRDGVCMSYDFR